jgi:protein phosphatase
MQGEYPDIPFDTPDTPAPEEAVHDSSVEQQREDTAARMFGALDHDPDTDSIVTPSDADTAPVQSETTDLNFSDQALEEIGKVVIGHMFGALDHYSDTDNTSRPSGTALYPPTPAETGIYTPPSLESQTILVKRMFSGEYAGELIENPAICKTSFGTVAMAIDTGIGRARNEDVIGIRHSINPVTGDEFLLLILADGMGGHNGGKEAAECIVSRLLDAPIENTHRAIDDACKDIQQMAQQIDTGKKDGPGACVSLSYLSKKDGVIEEQSFHAGDTRRLILDEEFRNIDATKDHTLAQEKFDAGEITIEELRTLLYKHIVTHCVGPSYQKYLDNDGIRIVRYGNTLLLFTDRLTDNLTDEHVQCCIEILTAELGRPPTSVEICQALGRLALHYMEHGLTMSDEELEFFGQHPKCDNVGIIVLVLEDPIYQKDTEESEIRV